MVNRLPYLRKGFWVFLLPGMIGLLLVIILPFLVTVAASFTKWNGVNPPTWVGLANYERAMGDLKFWASFRNNLVMILAVTVIPTILGLLVSVFLFDYITRKFNPGLANFFKVALYIPQVLPVAIAGVVWRWILNPNWGSLNVMLESVGLESLVRNWLGDPTTALPAVMVIMVWFQIGYPLVIFMAALQRVDPELLEAAEIDGATWLQKFFYITMHQIRPEIFVVVLTTTIYALKLFGQIYVLTRGGPGSATIVPSYYTYQALFEQANVGYGSTIATVMTVVIILLTFAFIRIQVRNEFSRQEI
ncbi:MAG: sugar ABC transporter permease [Chloroflexi bacterium]|nr:MAG: sugar ABC transporter permease [Chloroflexota bacterium]